MPFLQARENDPAFARSFSIDLQPIINLARGALLLLDAVHTQVNGIAPFGFAKGSDLPQQNPFGSECGEAGHRQADGHRQE